MYQSAGSYPSAQSSRSVELRTVTVLFGGRIGGPPTSLVAKPYRLNTMVPIALSRPDSGGAAAVEVMSAAADAANSTASVSDAAAALNVAAILSLRVIGTTAATDSTVASADSADSADSSGFGSSVSSLTVAFAAGCCLTATGLAALSAIFSAVSDPVGSVSLAAAGSSSGCRAGRS